jgi:hypothetical protein
MLALFGPILAAALVAQFQGGALEGKVVVGDGRPVAGAQVLFHAPAPYGGTVQAVEVRATTDAGGRFRLMTPPLGGVYIYKARVWASRPGSALAAVQGFGPAPALVLRAPRPRTIKIERLDGRPVTGARVSPRIVFTTEGTPTSDVPDTLAALRAVTTGPDGTATLDYLAAADQLVAVRVAAESIGTQDFQLIDQPGRDGQGAEITLRLKSTSRLTGRVRTRAGEPVAGPDGRGLVQRRPLAAAGPGRFPERAASYGR